MSTGQQIVATNIVTDYINGVPVANIGSGGGGGGSTTLDNTYPPTAFTTSAATPNVVRQVYNAIPGAASLTTAGTVKISDNYDLNDQTVAASTAATRALNLLLSTPVATSTTAGKVFNLTSVSQGATSATGYNPPLGAVAETDMTASCSAIYSFVRNSNNAFGTAATSAVTVGTSGQNLNLNGTVYINNSLYTPGGGGASVTLDDTFPPISVSTSTAPTEKAFKTLWDNVYNNLTNTALFTDIGSQASSAVNIGSSTQILNLKGSSLKINNNNFSVYDTYPPVSTDQYAAASARMVTQVYNAASSVPIETDSSGNFQPGYDIVVVLGQSNGVGMTGAGNVDLRYDYLDEDILMLGSQTTAANTGTYTHTTPMTNQGWTAATINQNGTTINLNGRVVVSSDPVHHASPWNYLSAGVGADKSNGTAANINEGVGFVRSFCRHYKRFALGRNRKIIIVGCAVPGSGFSSSGTLTLSDGSTANFNWLATGTNNLFTNAVKRIKIAMAYDPVKNPTPNLAGTDVVNPNSKCVAFLWHQGETDASTAQSTYLGYLQGVVDGLRGIGSYAATTPFICGGFAPGNYPTAPNAEIVQQQVGTYSYFGRYYCAFASSRLPFTLTSTTSESIHFDAPAQRIFGGRYFGAYLQALANTSTPVAATIVGTPTATVGTYNADTNQYAVSIAFATTGGAPTTLNVYSGVNATGTLLSSGTYTSPIALNITATTTAFTQNFYMVCSNAVNVSTPSTSSFSTTIPAKPSPAIAVTAANATLTTLNVTGTTTGIPSTGSITVLYNTSQTASGALTAGTCTGAQLIAGTPFTVTLTTTTTYYIYFQYPGTTVVTPTGILSFTVSPSVTAITSLSATATTLTIQATTQNIPSGSSVYIYTNTQNATSGATALGTQPTTTQLAAGTTLSGTFTAGTTYYVFFAYPALGNFITSPTTTNSFSFAGIKSYPPTAMSASPQTLSTSYGSGTYTATTSSLNASGTGWQPYKAFDADTTSAYATLGVYTQGSGAYTGTTKTTVGATDYMGEWIQIQLPVAIMLTSYDLTVPAANSGGFGDAPNCMIQVWTVLGSTDGTTWAVVDPTRNVGATGWGVGTLKNFSASPAAKYTYFRWALTQTRGGGSVGTYTMIGQINLNGYE